jgi:wobble nucleotide-excising tRNase
MIERFGLLRNTGQFDSVSPPVNIAFAPFSLIYAENGRGKTTLAAILRSLAGGDPVFINERQRLGSQNSPHIVVHVKGQSVIFQNGAWTGSIPNIAIFDDVFVAANVCSGIDLDPSHRQNLHELILGAQGVALSTALQNHVVRIERHNTDLRDKGDAIPLTARGPLSVIAFCNLSADPDIDVKTEDANRRFAAAKSSDTIRQRAGFTPIVLPDFDVGAIDGVLNKTLVHLEADAVAGVRAHLASLGHSGEAWVADGMTRIASASEETKIEVCPFCAQDLESSTLISHYQAYFSEAYEALKAAIDQTTVSVRVSHSGDIPTAFERSIRNAIQNQEFWKQFTELPDITVDTAPISREWTSAREAVLEQLRLKAASPLEPMALSNDALVAIRVYRARVAEIANLSNTLAMCNERLEVVKEQAAADDLTALTEDINKLSARKIRFDPAIALLCDAYLAESNSKRGTEVQREQVRDTLDQYRQQVFPAYEAAINNYLQKFNATFRLGQVQSVNTRAGSSTSYCMVINQQNVSINSPEGPSFRNTLSAGDRNTLALAFFFTSLHQSPDLADKIVVIDDPMTSLDEHRSLKTIQEMRALYSRVTQMIVFSHSKPFLCALWEGASINTRSATRISRAAVGSELTEWDVRNDSITEHDKRHELICRYIQVSDPASERSVAQALRPILEAFMRVAYPTNFPPGTLLGPFIGICQQRHGSPNEILSPDDTTKLRALLDYANRFHHDTNPAWETEAINDAELVDFAQRTLLLASRR